jgi:hypothetical protein
VLLYIPNLPFNVYLLPPLAQTLHSSQPLYLHGEARVLAKLTLIDNNSFAKKADIYNMKSGDGALGRMSDAASRSLVEIDANGEKPYTNRDEREMAYMGKKQQFKRNFGFMSMLGFSCTLMITWEGLFSVFVFGLEDGGPAGLVYGYIFCWVGYAAVVASLAEMVPMYVEARRYHGKSILTAESGHDC